jgi:hypothetical protein
LAPQNSKHTITNAFPPTMLRDLCLAYTKHRISVEDKKENSMAQYASQPQCE